MSSYEILVTDDAANDLKELYHYVTAHDAPEKSEYLLNQIESVILSLNNFPERGSFPPELLKLGIQEYRECFFKPYRVIYRTRDNNVYVMLIVDGRRDMQSLLERRLLSG